MSSQLSCDITAGKCFRLTSSNENIRLLYCDPLEDICYYIPFKERQSTVLHCPLSIFCLQVEDGTYVPIDDPIGKRHLNKAEEDERDRRWDAMRELLLDEPNVFDSRKRSLKMHKALKELDVHRSTLLSYLHNYWIGNKNRDALAPNYQHHTSRRNTQVGSSSKLGRPKSDPTHEGKHLTEQDLMNMDITLQKHYLNLNEPSLEHAYTQLVNTYYFREENGKIIRLPPDEIPSKQQLQTRLLNHFAPEKIAKSRLGPIKVAKDMGALSGRITGGLVSVGACAEIDATLCDIVPVSQYNYRMPGERETAYFVKDTRGMIMGFALYLGPPSSIGARLALINAFSDKVAFCAEYGITISEEDWPCHHIPRMLRTDHGELESEEFCQLVETLGITMELCAAYRGDQKPTVERNFGSLNTKVIHIENGNIKFRKDKKGLPPSAQTAELTHYEMMQKFIYYVLEQNKMVHTQRDPQSDWIQAAGIEHTPISIWKYCLRHGFSSLREVSPQEVRSALYFRTEGVLKADGIHVEIDKCHLHYTSPVISSEDWYRNVRFEEAHMAKKSQHNFTVLYHPMNIMHVYLLDPRGNREIQLTLKEEDSVYAQMPLFEVELTQDAEKKRLSSEKLHAKEETIEYNQASRLISEHAHEVKPDLSGLSKAEIQRQRKVSAAQEKAHQFKRPQSHAAVQEQDSLYDLQDSPFLHA